MAYSSSPLGKWRLGGLGHTPLIPRRNLGETTVAFPSSFWNLYENGNGHASSLCHEERDRIHGPLPSFLLGEGWVLIMTRGLPLLKLRRGQNTNPRKKVGKWPCPFPLPLLGSGCGVARATLPYFPRGAWKRSQSPSHLPSGPHSPTSQEDMAETTMAFPPSF